MKLQDMKALINATSLSKRNGVYTARKGFFYRHGKDSGTFAQRIADELNATILDHGEQWTPFRGGAPVARSSHWWVKFTVPE